LSDEDRTRLLRDVVASHVAVVLGHAVAGQINHDHAFRELGFDSLTAVELRNRLAEVTGLRLPATLVFDHPSIADLAGNLSIRLADLTSRTDQGDQSRSDIVRKLCIRAFENHKAELVTEFGLSGAKLRSKFDTAAQLKTLPVPARLSPGDSGPHLICICPPVPLPMSGPGVYARFAAKFGGGRKVSALMPPGFSEGEDLPATGEVLIDILATAVEDYIGDSAFALAGISSGGVLAYEVAKTLQKRGMDPTGVILMDTYRMKDAILKDWQNDLAQRSLEGESVMGFEFEEITAFAWICAHLFNDWEPEGLTVPTLLVRASDPIVREGNTSWQANLASMSSFIDVPGDHFTILEPEHVAAVFEVVNGWLVDVETNF
jgi:thioesterase domain-containing protein/acyl carrier protein